MSGAITAIATWASAAAANAALAAGATSATTEIVSEVTFAVVSAGITSGIALGVGAAMAPKVPGPQALQFPLKEAMPIRQSAFGRVRVAGAYVYYGVGTVGSTTHLSIDILALLDGRSQQFVSYYLNDDLMAYYGNGYWWAPGAPGKYGGGGSRPPNLVSISGRLGADTETSYSEIAPALPAWDANHRGDGVTSMALYCKEARREDQMGDYPNGVPTPSAVIDSQLIFDPRDGGQTQGDPSTYKFSDNPVLCLLAYLTDASGAMGLDYARFIAPALGEWQAAADECDGLVSTAGMHATLLDAASAGDHKIFLADTTGLTVGMSVQLATETVTVSGLGGAGEVDIAGSLTYAHSAGELAYWNAAGQAAQYRCAGVYKHDTPPGDVIKSILSTFDGWIGQRGDGALAPRTNSLYVPTVILGDRHIRGYQVQHFLPDEQAANQYIVSYTDPASAFNKAEAGYVQDDIDIAARGQVRSQPLELTWVPSAPQAMSVARAMLARSTQPLRGTITCNLAGLAVMGERFVRLQISELPDLNDVIVEVTGKVSIDLASMSVSFPFVAAGGFAGLGPQALCFIIDTSLNGTGAAPGILAFTKAAVVDALTLLGASSSATLDLCVVAGADTGTATSITKRAATASDIAALIAWVRALSYGASDGFDAGACLSLAKTFFDGADGAITARRIVLLWDSASNPGGGSAPATLLAGATAAQAVMATMSGVLCNVINIEGPDTTWATYIDNTPEDRAPYVTSEASCLGAIERAVFGMTSSFGAGYTLPPLAPPSGSPLQPLGAPTITSVTPAYPNSGGGVQGARLSIVVADPGVDATWKVQWKLTADSVWTDAGSSITASGTPLTILSGLIPASGSVDVQVAYVTASQVSPWSATTTVMVAAPAAVVTDAATATEALAAGNVCNLYTAAGAAKVQKANATDLTKPANCFVKAAFASGVAATVFMPGQWIDGLAGLTKGATYFLDTTGGGVTTAAPSAAGNGVQIVGVADSTGTKLFFQPRDMTGA